MEFTGVSSSPFLVLPVYKPEKLNRYLPGAGIVLFRQNQHLETYDYEILLVTSKKGSIGFPKGCQKNEDGGDLFITAARELYEESGIIQNQIIILNNPPFRECKEKNKLTCKLENQYMQVNKLNY